MSRRRSNAKPVVVEAPVASTPAGLPLAPVASPVVAAPALATAEDRIAELELLVEERDASIVALNATVEALRAQVAALASPRGADFFRGLMEFDGPQVCPRCQTLADLGDHGAEECEMRRDKGADRDLCPKCGTLDRDHTAEECAQRQRELAARWAEQHPGAAAGFVGAERAPRESA